MPTAHKVTDANKPSNTDDTSRQTAPSVHLEGFADAIPTPMVTAAPKPSSPTTPASPPPAAVAPSVPSPSQQVEKARHASSQFLQSALLSTLEASYTAIQSERDALQSRLSAALATVDSLTLENATLKSSKDETAELLQNQGKKWRSEVENERELRGEMEKKLRWSEERMDRLEAEGESLRGEIR